MRASPTLGYDVFREQCGTMRIDGGAVNGLDRRSKSVESFNGRLRDECLKANWFRTVMDARRQDFSAWRDEYNGERPHSSLGYRTPNEFAEVLRSSAITG